MAKRKSGKELSGGCLSLFGLPFLVAGLALSGFYFSGFVRWWSAQAWEEVPCWIESTELEKNTGSDSTTYKVVAKYRYEYGGRVYHGDKVTFHGGSDNIGSFHQDAHRELKKHLVKKVKRAERESADDGGKPFRCYVNPAKPEEAVLYRILRWPMQAFMAIFALTFPAVGAGLVVGGLLGVRNRKRETSLMSLHPGEPWKWRSDWAGSSIPEASSHWRKALFAYTGWSALVIFPLLISTALSGAFETDGTSWLLWIFALLWCVPAGFSIRLLRQRAAVGTVAYEPKESPGWPGGALEGSIVMSKPLAMRASADVSLICEKLTTRDTGDGQSTSREKVWSRELSVPRDLISRDLTGFRMPVRFELPADAPESGAGDTARVRHVWKLDLKVPGTPIHSEFEVPVFRTGKSPERVPEAEVNAASILDDASADLPALLAARRITAEFDHDGNPVSILCPPARHRSMIVFLIIFDLIWSAAAVFLIMRDAPLIFQLVWPLSSIGIWLLIFWKILHKRMSTFSNSAVEIRNQLGPVAWTEVYDKSRITGFSHDTNMSSNNTHFHRVRLESVLGKKKTLADGITESSTAAALVRRLEEWRSRP